MEEIILKGLENKGSQKIVDMKKERNKIISKSSAKAINLEDPITRLAKQLHPKVQYVKVLKVIEETEDVKTFVLGPNLEKGTEKLANFQPGQYVSAKVKIDDGIYSRPYSISCSPKRTLINNEYTITIKKTPNGIVSNYFYDEVEEGFTFSISAPAGTFYYQPLRDMSHVLLLAGGSGITPFMSMIEALQDGLLHCNLTLIYGAKSKEDLIFYNRLEELAKTCKKFKVIYILSQEIETDFETGFIEKELIDKYMEEENTFFVCGPIEMYKSLNEELKQYNLPLKYIHHDLFMSEIDLKEDKDFELTILTHDKKLRISCNGHETLLQAMEKNGVLAPNKCHVGECGFCRSKLVSGKVKTFDSDIRSADKNFNYVHPCCTYPESDVVLKLPN